MNLKTMIDKAFSEYENSSELTDLKEELFTNYQERLRNSEGGKTSETNTLKQISSELSDIDGIARELNLKKKKNSIRTNDAYGEDNSYKFEKNSGNSNSSNRVAGIVGLITFDVLISSWLLPVALTLVIVALVVPVSLFITSFTSVFTTYNIVVKTSLFAGTFALGVLSIVLLKISIIILKFVMQIVLNLHYDVIKGKSVKRFKFNYNLKLNTAKSKLALIASCLVVLGSTALVLVNWSNVKDNFYLTPDYIGEVYTSEVDLSETWNLVLDSHNSKIDVEFYDGTEIKFIYDRYEDDKLKINVNEESNTITFDLDQYVFSLSNLTPFQQKETVNVKAYIPSDLVINDLKLKAEGGINIEHEELKILGDFYISSYNASLTLSNIEADTVYINSYNGDLTISNVIANSLTAKSYNGDLLITDLKASDVNLKNYNGDINISNVTTIVDENSAIKIVNYNGDIVMNEVYIRNVDLSSYNGDIRYYNTDHDYGITFVNEPKTHNGDKQIYVGIE